MSISLIQSFKIEKRTLKLVGCSIVGGTGFYIQALLYDIDFSESDENNGEIRKKYEDIAHTKGSEYLHNMLKELDVL